MIIGNALVKNGSCELREHIDLFRNTNICFDFNFTYIYNLNFDYDHTQFIGTK